MSADGRTRFLTKWQGWAGYGVIVKATTTVDPLVFSLLRDGGAVLVLGISGMLLEGLHPIKKSDIPILLLVSTVGIFVNQVCLLVLMSF